MMKKIKLLIVDDSLVFREILARGISSDPDIEVVAKAINPYDARDKILEYRPDVMTCDLQMPKMNGVEFIRKLMPQYPLPVVVVSSVSEAVFEALNAGAVDFVTKPDLQSAMNVAGFINELIIKIKIASKAKVPDQAGTFITQAAGGKENLNYIKLIAIGASTGGTEAIFQILRALPPSMPGIIIVQHIPPVFSKMFAERLNDFTRLRAKEAETGDYAELGSVLVAPGGRHIRINKVGEKFRVECYNGEKVNGHCPSIDVLFESVAKQAGDKAIGIILTGMGYDGAKGLLSMRRKGARTIGQDESSSVVYGMPKVAFEIGAVGKQVSLLEIPDYLLAIQKV